GASDQALDCDLRGSDVCVQLRLLRGDYPAWFLERARRTLRLHANVVTGRRGFADPAHFSRQLARPRLGLGQDEISSRELLDPSGVCGGGLCAAVARGLWEFSRAGRRAIVGGHDADRTAFVD